MPYYEKVSCRIAIQVCIGFFPDGRERHRTFSIRNVDPDAPLEPIEAVVRALAPILAYPITKVRKVVKRRIFFREEAALPVPQTTPAIRDAAASFNSEYETEAALCGILNSELKSQRLILPLLLIPHSEFFLPPFSDKRNALPSPSRLFLSGLSPPQTSFLPLFLFVICTL